MPTLTLIPEAEYYAKLPKKRVAAAVLLFNPRGELLLLKPTYKDGWVIPGGASDSDESPFATALRETQEEAGVVITEAALLCCQYRNARGAKPEGLEFLFDGGMLSEEQLADITVDNYEISEFQFVEPEQALTLLAAGLQPIVTAGLAARKTNSVIYLET